MAAFAASPTALAVAQRNPQPRISGAPLARRASSGPGVAELDTKATSTSLATACGGLAMAVGIRVAVRRRGARRSAVRRLAAAAVETKVDQGELNAASISGRDDDELNRYRVAFAAEGTEPWRTGRVLSVDQSEAGSLVAIEVEASREFVALNRAYRTPGQRALLRFKSDGGEHEESFPVASPPVSLAANAGQLWRLKGDIFAGETKKEALTEHLKLSLEICCPNGTPAPEFRPGDEVEVGPFSDDGIDLRPVLGRFQAPVLAIFCDGSLEAVCHLRAALEAENCACELQPRDRSALLLFCGPPSQRLPGTLSAWLTATPGRFRLAASGLDVDPQESWASVAEPAIRRLVDMGEGVGALVLGSPSFVEVMSDRLAKEGVKLIAKSGVVHPLARVVDTEQI